MSGKTASVMANLPKNSDGTLILIENPTRSPNQRDVKYGIAHTQNHGEYAVINTSSVATITSHLYMYNHNGLRYRVQIDTNGELYAVIFDHEDQPSQEEKKVEE